MGFHLQFLPQLVTSWLKRQNMRMLCACVLGARARVYCVCGCYVCVSCACCAVCARARGRGHETAEATSGHSHNRQPHASLVELCRSTPFPGWFTVMSGGGAWMCECDPQCTPLTAEFREEACMDIYVDSYGGTPTGAGIYSTRSDKTIHYSTGYDTIQSGFSFCTAVGSARTLCLRMVVPPLHTHIMYMHASLYSIGRFLNAQCLSFQRLPIAASDLGRQLMATHLTHPPVDHNSCCCGHPRL